MLLMYYKLCGYCIVPTTCWCLSVIARNSQMSQNELRQVRTFKNAPPISKKGVFLLFKLPR